MTRLKDRKFVRWCRRYVSVFSILVVCGLVYILFVQENSLKRYGELTNTVDSLRLEIKNATDTMNYYHQLNERLSTDPELMERVVRENYNMVREGEDVYIFQDKK